MHLSLEDILAQESMYRRHFMNSLPGPRGVHLVGTKGYRGQENLGVFSSFVHISASSPPLLGFIMRPLTVPRHTYHHMKASGWFTVNTLHPDFVAQAHQTSANYPLNESEFAATGLTPEYSDACKAPYVKEASIKLGLSFEEEHKITGIETFFVVGRVREIFVPDEAVAETGHIDHELLETMTVAGLDTYHEVGKGRRFDYARVKKKG
ncbi:flavin reductase family protein [Neolewinella antarctica]|uniref:Flavin reductase (DIM6/NTAB) family NADH-FMN oxidoreductase RutF n=1 Tax=Neolewinella antarctica TaxID=442734 RepID=A0ABX0XFG1_9BACT|nr:flavin reductase [Neolewinella antarctica]NJC27482.1 flavin reductase (DIM6/NTAB) family NADH-FMN oxidoreductase RutF [Neolewinella antarctica]